MRTGITDDSLGQEKGTKVKIAGFSKHPSLFRPSSTLLTRLEGSTVLG